MVYSKAKFVGIEEQEEGVLKRSQLARFLLTFHIACELNPRAQVMDLIP